MKNTRKDFLRKKLIAALAMLLVASIMTVSSTYAWFVMSTAPEVSNIQTQMGANGALEIALLDQSSWNNYALLDMGDIDESANADTGNANLTWGNLINLSDSRYGLSKIVLNPARLNLQPDGGAGTYKVNETLLKTPIYNEDGRVVGLNSTAAVAYIHQDGSFSTEGHGVRAIGVAADMSPFQLAMNEAVSQISAKASAARTAASNALQNNGSSLADIVVQNALNGKTTGYTKTDITNIRKLAVDMQAALVPIEEAMRLIFAGFLATQAANIDPANYASALANVRNPETTIRSLYGTHSTISNVISGMESYVTKLETDQTNVQNAIRACNEKINGTDESFDWDEITAIIAPLVDYTKMTMGGKSLTELKDSLKNPDGSINYDAAFALIRGGGMTITVPTGSGLLSDIADFAGDYSAKVMVNNIQVGSLGSINAEVGMTTATTSNPIHLTDSRTKLRSATLATAAGNSAITDYYGYAIDLAFRTNAETSNLLLQTESAQRIYSDSTNQATQGGGSYMSFRTEAGLSAAKMVKLLSGVRVVFMDKDQKVLAVGALDCTLGKNVYAELSDEEKIETGKFWYLDGLNTYQYSDLITDDEYRGLEEESAVVFNKDTGEVTAKLYLYNFYMPMSTVNTDQRTGAMALDGKKETAVITPLTQDEVQVITTIVYLDGSVVNNSMVAADSSQSMVGTLNLQFASDADLIPAENSTLRNGDDGE